MAKQSAAFLLTLAAQTLLANLSAANPIPNPSTEPQKRDFAALGFNGGYGYPYAGLGGCAAPCGAPCVENYNTACNNENQCSHNVAYENHEHVACNVCKDSDTAYCANNDASCQDNKLNCFNLVSKKAKRDADSEVEKRCEGSCGLGACNDFGACSSPCGFSACDYGCGGCKGFGPCNDFGTCGTPCGLGACGSPCGLDACGSPCGLGACGSPCGLGACGPPCGLGACGSPCGLGACGSPCGLGACGSPCGLGACGSPCGLGACGSPCGLGACGYGCDGCEAFGTYGLGAWGLPHGLGTCGLPCDGTCGFGYGCLKKRDLSKEKRCDTPYGFGYGYGVPYGGCGSCGSCGPYVVSSNSACNNAGQCCGNVAYENCKHVSCNVCKDCDTAYCTNKDACRSNCAANCFLNTI